MTDQDDAVRREGLRVRKLAGPTGSGDLHVDPRDGVAAKYPLAGVVFLDERGMRTDVIPRAIQVPTDYVTREPWIEFVNPRPVTKPSGPPSAPWNGPQPPHTFLHADELILHMLDGDVRYRVVRQPDKYDADGNPTDVTGDPTTEVFWAYDADLIEEG